MSSTLGAAIVGWVRDAIARDARRFTLAELDRAREILSAIRDADAELNTEPTAPRDGFAELTLPQKLLAWFDAVSQRAERLTLREINEAELILEDRQNGKGVPTDVRNVRPSNN